MSLVSVLVVGFSFPDHFSRRLLISSFSHSPILLFSSFDICCGVIFFECQAGGYVCVDGKGPSGMRGREGEKGWDED